MTTRIMWIENKTAGDGLAGPARIGRVTFTKSGKSVRYQGRLLQPSTQVGLKANYFDSESGEEYWVSGCRKDGMDALYATDVEIDEDVREEYWRTIRGKPEMAGVSKFRAPGKY